MRKRVNFKIHTVTLIFLAFLFRLLFVNISLVSSLNIPQTVKRSHLSALLKRTNTNEEEKVAGTNVAPYVAVEVCEENTDSEEDLVKVNTPVILSVFFSFFDHLAFTPKSGVSLNLIKCCLHPKKYLSLSILRI